MIEAKYSFDLKSRDGIRTFTFRIIPSWRYGYEAFQAEERIDDTVDGKVEVYKEWETIACRSTLEEIFDAIWDSNTSKAVSDSPEWNAYRDKIRKARRKSVISHNVRQRIAAIAEDCPRQNATERFEKRLKKALLWKKFSSELIDLKHPKVNQIYNEVKDQVVLDLARQERRLSFYRNILKKVETE